ncbi:porin family protein [Histidinibacterium aquaticum]|uniref:DUF560 domain-containing protein n=1 Tax=Histidinibacterium aquaticum TaxID=2613962 RepID=A0A5J5GN98_9RHOB|nr:porin family protein [Histidinibacterium aquaticum]KAA9009856.1 DUF560 domain-containing protein [Histidinibacterium aquaticum]
MKPLLFPLLAAGALLAGPATAQGVALTPGETFVVASDLLDAGRAAEAGLMAEALVERDPTDVPALILRAETAVASGDFETARLSALSAWEQAEVDAARYASARLVALAETERGRYTPAQFWLRRARQYAPTVEAEEQVAEDYDVVRRLNPFSFSLDFTIAPSDNINNGSSNDTIVLPGLPFVFLLSGESQPLAGTEFTLGGGARYRIRQTQRTLTYLQAQGYVRTYRLSDEAKEIAPGAEGSDYAEQQIAVGIGHAWLPEGQRNPWRFSLMQGRFWYGGEPWSDFTRATVDRRVTLDEDDRLDFSLTAERLIGHETPDSDTYGLRAGWTHAFEDRGALTLYLKAREVTSEGFDRAYEARGGGIGWQFEGSGIEVLYDYEAREYERSAFTFGTREDDRHNLRLSVPVPGVEFYGFQPVVTAERSRTESNISRYETDTTGAGVSFRSAF